MTVPPWGPFPASWPLSQASSSIRSIRSRPVSGHAVRTAGTPQGRAGVRPSHCRSAVHHPTSSAVRVCRAAVLPSAHHPPWGRSADDGKPPCTRVEGKSSSTACGTRPSGEPAPTLAGRCGFSSVRCAVVSLRTITFCLSRPASDRGSGRGPVRAFRSSPSCRSCLAVPGAGPGLCQGAAAGQRGRGRNEGFRCGSCERRVGVQGTRFPARTGADVRPVQAVTVLSGHGVFRLASGRPTHLAGPCLGYRFSRPVGGRENAASSVRRWRGQRDGPTSGIGVGRWRGWSGAAAGRMSPEAMRWPCHAISRSLCPGFGMKQPPGRGLAVKPVTFAPFRGPWVAWFIGPVLSWQAVCCSFFQVCALDQRHVASGSDRSTRVRALSF